MPKIKSKKLPKSQIEVEIAMDVKEFQKYWQPAFDAAAGKVVVKGFRPGAAPKEMTEQGIDHDKVFEQAVRDAVRVSLNEYTSGEDFTLIDQPHVEVLDAKEGVTYKAILTVFPEVKLGNYQKIAKNVFADVKPIVIVPEEIEKAIGWLRGSRASTVLVARESKNGDLIELDVATTVEGKPLEGASFKGDRFVVGESHFIKGFDEKIENHKAGDDFSFSIVAPQDYWQKHLQGKTLDFKVKIHGVYDRKLPELNDEFAQTLGPTFGTVADLKKNIEEGLILEKKEKDIERVHLKVLEGIAKDSKMELPEIMVERTLVSMIEDVKRMLPKDSDQSPEAFEKELREKMRARAEQNVAVNLVMYQIAKDEKIEPTKEEVEADAKAHNVDLEKHYDYSYGRVQNKKVFTFLEQQGK
ncbi:MAG: trigger factor [bacterium]|nr:trigger factor [bacterium]